MQKKHSSLKETEEIWKLNSVYTHKLSWIIKWASVLKKTSLSTWQNWIILVNYINNGFPRWCSGKKKSSCQCLHPWETSQVVPVSPADALRFSKRVLFVCCPCTFQCGVFALVFSLGTGPVRAIFLFSALL